MAALSDGELRILLEDLDGWTHLGNAIHKEFRFPGFRGSIAFVNHVADAAEAAGHHPDIEIHYQRVMISLSTHDEGGVTEKDVSLAREIDRAADADDA
jgi:4a-hydroxytetrahydrobiopterin dehydratase